MRVKVTQEHIDKGEREECRTCPIALAIMEALGWTDSVKVEPESIFIADVECAVPFDATRFILEFDCGIYVRPFEFELDYHKEESR